jgi:hypothetical protein
MSICHQRFSCLILILLLVSIGGSGYAQNYYYGGDANYDGWCNYGDYNVINGWFSGYCDTSFCMDGADFNGNGDVNGLDLLAYVNFFNGSGPPPTGQCLEVIMTCDTSVQAEIWLEPVSDSNSDQATFSVYVEASEDIGALNFSYVYDPTEIASFATDNHSNVHTISVRDRAFSDGNNIVAFLVLCDNDDGVTYPEGTGGTRIFDITIDKQSGASNSLLRIVEDPVHGPPYFYFGRPSNCHSEDIICPFVPVVPAGDVNSSGTYNGLDVTYGVNYFKGGPPPTGKYFYNTPVDWNY